MTRPALPAPAAPAAARALPYEWQVGWRLLRGAGRGGNRFIAFISRVSMLGIALGVAALIVVLSVVNGFQVEVRDRMLGLVPHVSLVQRSGALADVAALRALAAAQPAVRASAPAVLSEGLLGRGDAVRGVILRGIDPALETQVSPVVAALPAEQRQALAPGSGQVLLGQALAQALGVKAGDRVVLVRPAAEPAGPASGVAELAGPGTGAAAPPPGRRQLAPAMTPLTVAGVFAAGHFELDNTLALLHWQDAATLAGLAGPNAVQVQLHDALLAPAVARELQAGVDGQIGVRDWTQVNRNWFESVQLQRRMLALILTLIVAVAAFNLVSTLVMTVTDKRGDIAILRTLGASPASVMAIFVVQGALAGVVGTAGGVALGLAIAHHLDVLVPLLEQALGRPLLSPSVYLIDHLPSLPRAGDVLPVAAVSLLLSLLATLYPSWRASRLEPAAALRQE